MMHPAVFTPAALDGWRIMAQWCLHCWHYWHAPAAVSAVQYVIYRKQAES
jgi:hypothetical protein